jgi:hypothetical protein
MDLDKKTGLPYQQRDLQMRLGSSLVMHKGRPFYVVEIDGLQVSGYYTDTQKIGRFTLPNKQLDIRPVPLGYVNTTSDVLYCSRLPHRRYKQGLNSANLVVNKRVHSLDRLIKSVSMAKLINNEFPSMEDAYARMNKHSGCAFHRYWAFVRQDDGVHLHYRGIEVGKYQSGNLVLLENFTYLKEELEDAQ